MTLLIRNPDLENEIDREEYFYDEYIGKWIKRRKEKRLGRPKVIARKKKRLQRQGRKNRPLRHRRPSKKRRTIIIKNAAPVKHNIRASNVIPLTRKEAQVHKNANKAIQEELKTKQEELKTIGLGKKVEQEAAKTEQIKGQTQMTSTGRGLFWVVGIVGAVLVLKFVFGNGESSPSGSQSNSSVAD